jgi:hypothetical protein
MRMRMRRAIRAHAAPGTAHLAPLATRAFTPVFDGLWRGKHGKVVDQDSAR